MRKILFFYLLPFFAGLSPLWALTAEIDRIDYTGAAYSALPDTDSVKYVDHCTRGKFDPYEWKTWEGYYSVRAFIQPIAVVTIKREPNEFFGGNLDPYIRRAEGEAAKLGCNMLCFVRIKKNKELLEPDAMIFRAYKQLFQAGNDAWTAFFGEIMTKGILLTLEDIQLGEKTKYIQSGRTQPVQPSPAAPPKPAASAAPPALSTPSIQAPPAYVPPTLSTQPIQQPQTTPPVTPKQ